MISWTKFGPALTYRLLDEQFIQFLAIVSGQFLTILVSYVASRFNVVSTC